MTGRPDAGPVPAAGDLVAGDAVPRRADGVAVRPTDAGCVACDPERGRVHVLNGTAALVLELCTGAIAAREIPRLVADAFGLAEPPIAEVTGCLRRLLDEGLIRLEAPAGPAGPPPPALPGPPAFLAFERLAGCPVCGHPRFAAAFGRDVQRCGRCRVLFRSPRPTQAEIQRSYESGSTFGAWAGEEPIRRVLWQARVDGIVRAGARGRLLDVGTGDGHFLVVAARAGFEVEATELSRLGVRLSRSRGFAVRRGQLLDIDFSGRTFDVITMWHALEHLPDPGGVLRRSHQLLRPGGLLAVAVPNADHSLVWGRLGFRRGLDVLEPPAWGGEIHLTHFRPGTLRTALRAAGFEILEFGVDDTCTRRTAGRLAALAAQRTLNRLLGWHFSVAMYCLARRR